MTSTFRGHDYDMPTDAVKGAATLGSAPIDAIEIWIRNIVPMLQCLQPNVSEGIKDPARECQTAL
jgi:hypothetical protein